MLMDAVRDGGARDDHWVAAVLSSDESGFVRSVSNCRYRTMRLESCQAPGTKILEQRVERAAGGYHSRVITLGIDPGTAICGFGVVALEGGRLRMLDAGCIRTPSDASDAERLRQRWCRLRDGLHRREERASEKTTYESETVHIDTA